MNEQLNSLIEKLQKLGSADLSALVLKLLPSMDEDTVYGIMEAGAKQLGIDDEPQQEIDPNSTDDLEAVALDGKTPQVEESLTPNGQLSEDEAAKLTNMYDML